MDAQPAGEEEARPDGTGEGDFAIAREALAQAVRVAESALALLRAELRLARSSALMLVWLSFLLVFLGVGAWLAASAAIAVGVYLLSGNLFYGVGSVALANAVGIVLVLRAMKTCWRDIALPRTRRVISHFGTARA
ncbi:MAG: hypothetical protein ACTHK2_16590 [Dokdonella sp.]|uniref:hypothetical protein n=1 Tax=Dokdonella sp. TaxID=2291710 RepID=UPI003F7CDE04